LVNDVLDHSRLEAGKVPLDVQPFELAALLQQVRFMLGPATEAKGLTLKVTVDPKLPAWYHGDAARLRQVLVNLVSNAIKFTPRGGVSLHAEPGPGEGPGLRLRVDVSGPGMTTAARERVFEPYVQ
jgi:signal transduction histidine kinase